MDHRIYLVSMLVLSACGPTASPGRASSTAAVATAPRAAAPPTTEAREADVAIEVRAPLHARYDSAVLAAAKPTLGIVVTNRTDHPIDVSDLRVHLSAARNGIDFHCNRVVGPALGEREASTLGPRSTTVFDRTLDCALPLVGSYAVRVGVSFGEGEWKTPHEVRAFGLTVTALPAVTPREISGQPGLWASMGSSTTLLGSPNGGHGRTLIAIVNATRAPVEPPRMHLALRVFKTGSSIPCEDQPVALAVPDVLGPGQTYYEPVEVSCLGLSVPGTYEVVARLIIRRGTEGDREIPIGRLRVEVVTDPSIPYPRPWR